MAAIATMFSFAAFALGVGLGRWIGDEGAFPKWVWFVCSLTIAAAAFGMLSVMP